MKRGTLVVRFAALVLILAGGGAAAAVEPVASDPYAQAEALLRAEVSDPVILSWAESLDALPPPSAAELIALKQAGASETLLQGLLDLARTTTARRAGGEDGVRAGGQPVEAAPVAAPVAAPGTSVPALFRLTYQPRFDDGEEPWDLFVYLDGEALAHVPRGGLLGRDGEVGVRRSLRPGRHHLRVAQERHQHRFGRWSHQARVSRQEFGFELTPGPEAAIELEFHQPWLGSGEDGAVSFRLAQGEREVALERAGGDPAGWPPLCEEVETAVDPGRRPGREVRRQLADCLRWSELWSGLEVPSRERVREGLEGVDFQPRPARGDGNTEGDWIRPTALLSQ